MKAGYTLAHVLFQMISRLSTLTLAFSAISLSADEVRIAASDLLAEYIKAPLTAHAEVSGVDYRIESIGSLPAMEGLKAGEVDLAIVAVPEADTFSREQFRVYPFAYDVAVIAVNESNPIHEISLESLGGIFGSKEEFNYNSWGDLGLSGWRSRSIKPIAGQVPDSVSLELFKYTVFRGGAMKSSVDVVKDSEVEGILASDAASIAILSHIPKKKEVKALMVASSKGAPAFGPTEDNVHFGDYPIRLPFYIVFNIADEDKIQQVVRVLLDEPVAKVLNENYLVALPETVRRQLTIDLEMSENGL